MIGMMSYSNIQSHRELVMRSEKDYQEFIETLIQFNTHVIEEVPLLKIVATLEQMKKEMEECMRELNELGVETSEIRETDEGGVEESKGAEKSLMQRVEERLQSLVKEKKLEIKHIEQEMRSNLEREISQEGKNSIEQKMRERTQEIELGYHQVLNEILGALKILKNLQVTYDSTYEVLQKFKRSEQTALEHAEIDALERRFSLAKSLSESAEEIISASTIEVGIRI